MQQSPATAANLFPVVPVDPGMDLPVADPGGGGFEVAAGDVGVETTQTNPDAGANSFVQGGLADAETGTDEFLDGTADPALAALAARNGEVPGGLAVDLAGWDATGETVALRDPDVVPAASAAPATAPIKIFEAGERIVEIASFSAKTRGVTSMSEQMASGRGTAHSEFVQGMVDFGSDNEPPPRIYLIYDDGRVIAFRGRGFERRGLLRLEYFNAGKGLRPEDTVMDESRGGEDRLGTHGHGTSYTLTYLSTIGIPVEIHSNYEGQAWRGQAGLAPSTTGTSDRLQVTGEWLGTHSNETRFVVHLPLGDTREMLLDRLETLPEYFLYANPRFPGSVVEPTPDAPKPSLAMPIDKGRIMCLRGVVPWDAATDRKTFYIDGLQASERDGRSFLFPWFMRGFRNYPREQGHPLRLKRSFDSGSVEGTPTTHIAIALRHCTDPELLSQLIDAAVDATSDQTLPIELQSYYSYGILRDLLQMSPETAQLLASLWRDKHGDALITNEDWVVTELAQRDDVKVVRVRGSLYEWLKEVGIGDGKDAAKFKRTSVPLYDSFEVDYADLPLAERLERLMQEAIAAHGTVVAREVEGVKVVQVLFPISFLETKDLSSSSKHGVKWMRAAAVIAHKSDLNIAVKSGEGIHQTEIQIRRARDWGDELAFDIDLRTVSNAAEKPYLLVTLSGDPIQALTPPPAMALHLERIAATALRQLMDDEAKRSAALPQVPNEILTAQQRLNAARRDLDAAEDALRQREATYREELEREHRERLDALHRQSKELDWSHSQRSDALEAERARLAEAERRLEREMQERHAELARETACQHEEIERERDAAEAYAARREREAAAKEERATREAERRLSEAAAEEARAAAQATRRLSAAAVEEERVEEVARQRRGELDAAARQHDDQVRRDQDELARQRVAAERINQEAAERVKEREERAKLIEQRTRTILAGASHYVGQAAGILIACLGTAIGTMEILERLGLDDDVYRETEELAAAADASWQASHTAPVPAKLVGPTAAERAVLNGPKSTLGVSNDYDVLDAYLEGKRKGKPIFAAADKPEALAHGYYREHVNTTLYINPLTQRATWGSHQEFVPISVSQTVPDFYAVVMHRPLENQFNPILVHEGHVITAIVSEDGSPVTLEREVHTGVYRLVGEAEDVAIYTAPSPEPYFNSIPFGPEELRQMVNVEELLPHWRTLFKYIHERPDLTLEQRAALVIHHWAQYFEYAKPSELSEEDLERLDKQMIGTSVSEVEAKMNNTMYFQCNGEAGLVADLRAAGVPARGVSGLMVYEPYPGHERGMGKHAWTEFWNGRSWVAVEHQTSRFSEWQFMGFEDSELGNPALFANTTSLKAATALLVHRHKDLIEEFERKTRVAVVVPGLQPPQVTTLGGELQFAAGFIALGAGLAWFLTRRRRPPDNPPAAEYPDD